MSPSAKCGHGPRGCLLVRRSILLYPSSKSASSGSEGAEEAGPAGHQYPLFEMHLRSVCPRGKPAARPSYCILGESDYPE
jgi:hypothetical protein